MSSIIRPSPAQMRRRLLVLAAAVFSVLVAQAQMLMGWGQSAAEFAADSDATLRVANWAFAIWGVIYLGLLAYALRQALPQTGESDLLTAFGWPSAAALVGIGLWIVAAAFDWEIATIVLIFASAVVLIVPLLVKAAAVRALPRLDRDRWFTAWPLGLLAGWLSIAAPLNLLTVATGNNALPTGLASGAWAVLALAAVAALALLVTWRTRLLAYPLPIAWGLIGAFAAEQGRNPTVAFTALGAAVAVLLGATALAYGLKPGIERA